MAKLAAKDRKKVEKAEANSGEFTPLTPGKYLATLAAVETKTSGAGNAYWNAEFSDIISFDGEKQPGRQWYMLMLPLDTMPEDYKPKKGGDPKEKWEQYQSLTAGRIKAFFEAFGYTVDSDTDEMIGDQCVLQIGVETIQSGTRAGQKTNRVNAVLPASEAPIDGAGGGDSEDEF